MIEVKIIKHYGTKDVFRTGEYNTEIQIDGKVFKKGDEYHDKMDTYAKAVVDVIMHTTQSYRIDFSTLTDEEDLD